MKDRRGIRNLLWAVALSAAVISTQPIGLSAQTFNLAKEAADKKIVWKDAPSEAIPREVCTILAACGGQAKLIVQPPATEAGGKVARGMFRSPARDGKGDLIILERQTYNDKYFFSLSADGNMQKAALLQLGGKQWQPVAASLVQPTFEKEKKSWHDYVAKLGTAPAAPAPQSN